MNDRRFIELLNLYLDHHIGAEESAELEAEILRNPARRRTYDQYCRLQRGCSLLCERERSVAPASQAFARSLRDAERKISTPQRSVFAWRTPYVGAAFGAMAACLAVIVVVNRSAPSDGVARGGLIAQSTPEARMIEPVDIAAVAPAAEPAVMAMPASVPVPAPVSVARLEAANPQFAYQPVVASTHLGVIRNAREAEIAATDREALEWMQRVELLPVHVVDDQAFEGRPTLQQDNRVFRSRQAPRGNTELTAFQFQR